MAELIVEENLIAVRRAGERVEVRAGIGRPYPAGSDEWACPVSLAGLHDGLHDVHGESSLQSMCLALRLLRTLLTSFVEDGGRLYHRDGRRPFDIVTCFG
jgi:hypothetical protein